MRSRGRPSPEGARMLLCFAGGTVSPMMRPADGRQKDDKKRWDGRNISKDEGRDRAPKYTVDCNDVAGLFACCFVVIRCDIAGYIAIYRVMISHIMRCYNIRYYDGFTYIELPGLKIDRLRTQPRLSFITMCRDIIPLKN